MTPRTNIIERLRRWFKTDPTMSGCPGSLWSGPGRMVKNEGVNTAAWVAWHEARFPDSTAMLVAGKLVEEIGELWSALLVEDGRTSAKTEEDVLAEAANVFGCLIVLIHRWGYGDLLRETQRQLDDLMSPTSKHRSSLADAARVKAE